jgi:hypothetical protein
MGLMLVACQPPEVEKQSFSTRITIAQLYDLTNDEYEVIDSDWYIKGVIVADDRNGNFDRALVISDGERGVELVTGLYDNTRIYPEGICIEVNLQGLAVDKRSGIVRIGLPTDTDKDSTPQPLYHTSLLMRHISTSAPTEPVPTVNAELVGDWRERLGCRVTICDVWCAEKMALWRGVHPFCNTQGDTLWVRTIAEAHFAADSIPSDTLTLKGIVYDKEFRMIDWE